MTGKGGHMQFRSFSIFSLLTLCFSLAQPLNAFKPEPNDKGLKPKEFIKPELSISTSNVELQQILGQLTNAPEWNNFFSRYGSNFQVFIEPRTGKPTNILGHIPIIPGDGLDNRINLQDVSQN
jgi:trimeric autotransporter adhesin